MKKSYALLMTFFVLFVVSLGTWHLFQGNLEAAFSTFPFLLIIYLFMKNLRK